VSSSFEKKANMLSS
jgi:hypothetical protein